MARSGKIKAGISNLSSKGSKVHVKSGPSASSPLMRLGKKNYAKQPKPVEVQQFGMPTFGLTGMTGED